MKSNESGGTHVISTIFTNNFFVVDCKHEVFV